MPTADQPTRPAPGTRSLAATIIFRPPPGLNWPQRLQFQSDPCFVESLLLAILFRTRSCLRRGLAPRDPIKARGENSTPILASSCPRSSRYRPGLAMTWRQFQPRQSRKDQLLTILQALLMLLLLAVAMAACPLRAPGGRNQTRGVGVENLKRGTRGHKKQ